MTDLIPIEKLVVGVGTALIATPGDHFAYSLIQILNWGNRKFPAVKSVEKEIDSVSSRHECLKELWLVLINANENQRILRGGNSKLSYSV